MTSAAPVSDSTAPRSIQGTAADRPPSSVDAPTPKALLPWLGRPLIRYQLEQIAKVGAETVVVVTGFHARRVAAHAARFPGVQAMENPDPARGRSSSIAVGVSALPESLTAFAVINVDQPCSAAALGRLFAVQTAGDQAITIPRYRGQRGHPPVFAGSLREAVMRVREETQGLKAITRAHRAETRYVDLDDPGIAWNLNTPADYRRAQRQHILLATTNRAKADHLAWLLEGVPLRRLTLAEANLDQAPPPENAATLADIAAGKAVAWSRACGGLALASDGGIAIPALGDRWEERLTARFAGADASDEQRVQALLALLRPYRGADRRACFRETVALADNGRLLQKWSAASAPGLLAESYRADQLVAGFWLLTLWLDPQSGRRVGAHSPDDPNYPAGAWARIRPGVQEYLYAYCERAFTAAT